MGWAINNTPPEKSSQNSPQAITPSQTDMTHAAVEPARSQFDASLKFVEMMGNSGFRVDDSYLQARNSLSESQKGALDKQLLRYADMLYEKRDSDKKVAAKLKDLIGVNTTDKHLLERLYQVYVDEKQYLEATYVLADLKRLAQFSDEYIKIETLIKQTVDANINYLQTGKKQRELEEFLELVVNMFPADYEFKWRQAKYYYNSHQYDKASFLLEELRYVSEYTEQVEKLSDNIKYRVEHNDDDGIVVALIKRGESYFVKGMVNDYEPVKLLIDTGASMTTITPELAYSLGISEQDFQQFATFNTANGQISAPIIQLSNLRIGRYKVDNLPVGILSLTSDAQFQGLLGMNFLKHFKFFIDQKNMTLELFAQH